MHALRSCSMLARLVMAWFVLALGVAVASPIVHPKLMEIVCSAAGSVKIVVAGADGPSVETGPHTLDCALCLAATVPPPQSRGSQAMPQPLAHALKPIVAAHIAAWSGAPLPARGPPFFG